MKTIISRKRNVGEDVELIGMQVKQMIDMFKCGLKNLFRFPSTAFVAWYWQVQCNGKYKAVEQATGAVERVCFRKRHPLLTDSLTHSLTDWVGARFRFNCFEPATNDYPSLDPALTEALSQGSPRLRDRPPDRTHTVTKGDRGKCQNRKGYTCSRIFRRRRRRRRRARSNSNTYI